MENKINVYWIEDVPVSKNVIKIDGREYPNFIETTSFRYFLFQHPKQVQEFLIMLNTLKNEKKSFAQDCPYALPDIVVFDYMMAKAFDNNRGMLKYHNSKDIKYLRSKSISHKLREAYQEVFITDTLFLDRQDVTKFRYGRDAFANEIGVDEILNDDEFGLYSGITLVREFKDYITVGVPATVNKKDSDALTYQAHFYEWINSYDLGEAIKRPKGDKDWNTILPFGVQLLRKRIHQQLSERTISVDLNNIIELLDCYSSQESMSGVMQKSFKFKSAYGWREISLAALFYDCKSNKNWESEEKRNRLNCFNEQLREFDSRIKKARRQRNFKRVNELELQKSQLEKRGELFLANSEQEFKIWEFLETIHTSLGTTSTEIAEVKRISNRIMDSFKADVQDRLALSYLLRTDFKEKDEAQYKSDELEKLYQYFGVNDELVIPSENEISIIAEIKRGVETSTIRLAIGHLITKAYLALNKAKNISRDYEKLEEAEIYCLLCPVSNAAIVRGAALNEQPKHYRLFHPLDIPPKKGIMESYIKSPISAKIDAPQNSSFFQFNWFTEGEKVIIKSLFPKTINHPYFLK